MDYIDISNEPNTGLKRKIEFISFFFDLQKIVMNIIIHYYNQQDEEINFLIAPRLERLEASNAIAVYSDNGELVDPEDIDPNRSIIGEFDFYMKALPTNNFSNLEEIRNTLFFQTIAVMDSSNRFD